MDASAVAHDPGNRDDIQDCRSIPNAATTDSPASLDPDFNVDANDDTYLSVTALAKKTG